MAKKDIKNTDDIKDVLKDLGIEENKEEVTTEEVVTSQPIEETNIEKEVEVVNEEINKNINSSNDTTETIIDTEIPAPVTLAVPEVSETAPEETIITTEPVYGSIHYEGLYTNNSPINFNNIREENKNIIDNGGNNMEDKSLVKLNIEAADVTMFENTIKGEYIKELLKNKLMANVEFYSMSRQEFHVKFLASYNELTAAEKEDFTKEFYPSAITGSSVDVILAVDIPASVLESISIENQESIFSKKMPTNAIFWNRTPAELKGYTKLHKDIFGSKIFTPALSLTNPVTGETVYRIFIPTLTAILFAQGITLDDLIKNNTAIAVSNVIQHVVDNTGGVTNAYNPLVSYIVKYRKK